MTAVQYDEPPRSVDDPRPRIETLRAWPFIVLGCGAVAVLGAVTIGPSFFSDTEPKQVRDDTRMTQPRSRSDLPSDYSQIREPEKIAEDPPPEAKPDPGVQKPAVERPRMSGGGSRGPTRAEILRDARMADFKTVAVTAAGYVGEDEDQTGGEEGSSGTGSKLYSKHKLTDPFPCQVNAGTNIPAMTEQRITSESPGTVTAITTRDIWSADKRCLAIPRGTRFVGQYQTQVAEGQARLGIMWTGLTRPPPRLDTIDLDTTVAGDPDGTAGVSGEVNGFFWRKLGYVAAASILDIGKTTITAAGEGGVGSAIAGIFANNASSPIDEWARRQLDIPSVIQVEPREISIVLAQHQPMNEFRSRR